MRFASVVDVYYPWHILAMASATKNFHLPLPAATYAELHLAADRRKTPATKLAHQLVEQGLERLRRAERRRDIAAYAAHVAGSSDDLDTMLEAAGIDSLEGDR